MSSQGYRSVSEMVTDDFPNLTPLPEGPSSSSPSTGFFSKITLQTWIIIILLLAFLGINIFTYLAKGTQETVSIFSNIFEPILKFFGYTTLTTTKQVIETSATGATTGINMVAETSTDAIDNIIQTDGSGTPVSTSGTSTGVSSNVPQGNISSTLPVQQNLQKTSAKIEKWQEDALSKALLSAKQKQGEVSPDDSRSSIQTTGKSGWCYIGDDQGLRTCSEIGVNDVCMSGDIFPTQPVCINPKLRA
jgi:hypothetical protein